VHRRGLCIAFGLGWALVAAGPRLACADLVRLANGGQLRGEFNADADLDDAPEVELRTLTGAVVIVERRHIASLEKRRLVLEEYESRAKSAPVTVDDQWELAQWCRENHLAAQRRTHLQNVVRLDPDHKLAHRLLGHVLRDRQWISKDDLLVSQGYVKYEGEFVTPQERDLLQQRDNQEGAEKNWHKQVRLWFLWSTGRNPERRGEGLAQLQAIVDPDAIPGLAHFLGNHRDVKYRVMFVKILGQIPGERPVAALVLKSLLDADRTVRGDAFDAILPERYPFAVPFYVSGLGNDANDIVCRAASALGRIGDEHVVPQLIEALVTTHSYKVRVPTNEGTYSFNSDASTSSPNDLLLPAEIEKMLRTGQLANGVIVVQPQKQVRTKVITVKHNHQNAEVLSALTKLTGQTFGFDENVWRLWWSSQKNKPAG